MKPQELNKYIKHYLEKDKTHSAIMLSGGWGTGKSYYIQNELDKYLEVDGRKRCVIVSLYGLKDVSEISKAIYLELRIQPWLKKVKSWISKTCGKFFKNKTFTCETTSAVYGIGKTLLKGFVNSKMEISIDDKDLKRLFESVNLSDKLIILEDIERSEINPLQLLGYVNGLVEHDNIKVMLVANESEFLQYEKKEVDATDIPVPQSTSADIIQIEDIPIENTLQYLKAKEKTVSDTIIFENDYYFAIRDIINSFESETLKSFVNDNDLEELQKILNRGNLRSFIFACQKTVDLYEKIKPIITLEKTSIKTMFFGIVLFSQVLKKEEKVCWEGDSNLSLSYGGIKYPLFRFCYDYITKQEYNEKDVEKNINSYKDLLLYNRDYSKDIDEDIATISYYYQCYEKDVIKAVKNIENRLQNPEDISFFAYRGLAKGLLQISRILEVDISLSKERMIKNLHGRGNKLNEYFLFGTIPGDGNSDDERLYEDFKTQMIDSLRDTGELFLGFDYTPETIMIFYMESLKDGRIFNAQEPYAQNLDVDRLSAMLYECSPEQIETLRRAFLGVYRLDNINEYLSCDKCAIEKLLENIKNIIDDNRFDRIQKIQLEWFAKNLEEILMKL